MESLASEHCLLLSDKKSVMQVCDIRMYVESGVTKLDMN